MRAAPPRTAQWWLALGYAGLAAWIWLVVALRRGLQYRLYQAGAQAYRARGDLLAAEQVQAAAGALLVDLAYAVGAALVCAAVAIALTRRSWNAWDYATLLAGLPAVGSLIFVCAPNRVMLWLPFTFAPLLALLYLRGVKQAMGVDQTDAPPAALTADELDAAIHQEQALIARLSRDLARFEAERGLTTDAFVQRYADGLEEDTPDNAEWFAMARALRRHHARLDALLRQRAAPDAEG